LKFGKAKENLHIESPIREKRKKHAARLIFCKKSQAKWQEKDFEMQFVVDFWLKNGLIEQYLPALQRFIKCDTICKASLKASLPK